MQVSLEELRSYLKNDMPMDYWISLINDEEIQNLINDTRKRLAKKPLKFKSTFVEPTPKEVLDYMTECKHKYNLIMNEGSEAGKFYDRQRQIGWQVKVGKDLFDMKDWKAAIRTHLRYAESYGTIKRRQ